MLPDDIVLKNTYYWASKMVCKEVEFNELVSIGYIVGKQLDNPKKLKDWIRFTMLHFITDTIRHNNEHIEFKEELGSKYYTQKTHDYSVLYKHIAKARLTKMQMRVITLVFFDSYTQKKSAGILGITPATVNEHVKRALMKIQRTYMFNSVKSSVIKKRS